MQNVAGLTFVAMAAKFRLCVETQSPTGLFFLFVSASATDCLERLVSEMTYYVLNSAY